MNEVEGWLWDGLPDALGYSSPPWFLVIDPPVVGAGVVIAARTLLAGDGGHRPLDGLSATPTPLAYGPGVALAALGTLSFGAVLGPGAPLIALGSVVGMAATRFVSLGDREQHVLATAGSFSAVSALFGGPLVAGILLLEAGVAAGRALIPALPPGLVAAAIGYVLFVGLGDWGGLDTTALAIPGLPSYTGTHIGDLLVGLAVGVAAAVLITAVRRLGGRVARGERRLGMAGLLLAGGLAVGVLAQVADLLGANSQDVLFSGQAAVPAELREGSAGILLVVVAAKAIGYAVCLGGGFRGGPVFPAIFPGVGAGDVRRDRLRDLADAGGGGRHGGGHGGDDAAAVRLAAVRGPAGRPRRARCDTRGGPGGVGRVGDDDGDRSSRRAQRRISRGRTPRAGGQQATVSAAATR